MNLKSKKEYFLIQDFANDAGVTVDDLIHLGARDSIRIHVLADNWLGDAYVLQDGDWVAASPHQGTVISGPIQLYSDDLELLESTGNFEISRLKGNTGGRDPHDGDEVWEYRLRTPIPVTDCKLLITAFAIRELEKPESCAEKALEAQDESCSTPSPSAEHSAEKELTTRERNGLLKIIATLADLAELDPHRADAASKMLEDRMSKIIEQPIKSQTISDKLKAAFSFVDIKE